MKLERTSYSNYQLVIDEFNIPVAVRVNGEDKYRLYDLVQVTDDGHGNICPGISHGGIGIVTFLQDATTIGYITLYESGYRFSRLQD